MRLFFFLCAILFSSVRSFSSSVRTFRSDTLASRTTHPLPTNGLISSGPSSLQRQRFSVAPVQTMVFGLGAPEIAIIMVAAAFLLGPEKLAELGKDAGKIAGELKEVPKEFQAGLKEGEESAKATKQANVVEAVKESSSDEQK